MPLAPALSFAAGATLAAAPLDVVVEAHPAPPRAAPIEARPTTALPVARGTGPTLDGRLNEPSWAVGATWPALLPALSQGGAHPARTRALAHPEGLSLGIEGLAQGDVVFLLVDPDGNRQGWWRARIQDQGLEAEWCTLAHVPQMAEAPVHADAAPCTPVDPPRAAHGPGTLEITIPWSHLGAPTSRASVAMAIRNGRQQVAILAPGKDLPLTPRKALRLNLGERKGRLSLDIDPLGGPWTARLRGAAEPSDWEWRLWDRGRVVESGPAVAAGSPAGTFQVRVHPPLGFALEVRQQQPMHRALGPVVAAKVVRGGETGLLAGLVSPVFEDSLRVAWHTSTPVQGLPLVVRAGDGAVLGTAQIDLPRGHGILRIVAAPAWPDAVGVEMPPALPHAPAVRAP